MWRRLIAYVFRIIPTCLSPTKRAIAARDLRDSETILAAAEFMQLHRPDIVTKLAQVAFKSFTGFNPAAFDGEPSLDPKYRKAIVLTMMTSACKAWYEAEPKMTARPTVAYFVSTLTLCAQGDKWREFLSGNLGETHDVPKPQSDSSGRDPDGAAPTDA